MRELDFKAVPNTAAAHAGPLTVSSTAVNLRDLVTLHADTQVVLVSVETASVRFTVNGTAPTSTLGFATLAGAYIRMSRNEADLARFIRSTGTDAALQVAQYKD